MASACTSEPPSTPPSDALAPLMVSNSRAAGNSSATTMLSTVAHRPVFVSRFCSAWRMLPCRIQTPNDHSTS